MRGMFSRMAGNNQPGNEEGNNQGANQGGNGNVPPQGTGVANNPLDTLKNVDHNSPPGSKGGNQQETAPKSPLEDYTDLWQPNTDKDGNPLPANKKSFAPSFQLDPKKLFEAANKMDFSRAITPESAEKAKTGDYSGVIQDTNRASYGHAINTMTQIFQKFIGEMSTNFENDYFPEMMRRHQASNNLDNDNEMWSNPAVAPMLQQVKEQLANKYPEASAAEITKHAKKYVEGFASELVTKSGKTISDTPDPKIAATAAKKEDWEDWFTKPSELTR